MRLKQHIPIEINDSGYLFLVFSVLVKKLSARPLLKKHFFVVAQRNKARIFVIYRISLRNINLNNMHNIQVFVTRSYN